MKQRNPGIVVEEKQHSPLARERQVGRYLRERRQDAHMQRTCAQSNLENMPVSEHCGASRAYGYPEAARGRLSPSLRFVDGAQELFQRQALAVPQPEKKNLEDQP